MYNVYIGRFIIIKMKKYIIILFLIFALKNTYSQNLVPNPGFDTSVQCPYAGGKIYYATPWFQPNIGNGNTSSSSSTDLFDTCSNFTAEGVPTNEYGTQNAYSAYGYAGIIPFGDTTMNPNYGEYLEVPLMDTLKANKKYCVQFYVSLAECSKYSISNLGAYFSNDSLLAPNFHAIDTVSPQVENPITNMLNDTINWMLVSGYFIANGGERFMTIGNFHSPSTTNAQLIGASTALYTYYYIDNASVVYCDPSGVEEMEMQDVEISPNPATNEIKIESKMQNAEIEIRDVLGQIVYSAKAIAASSTIDVSMLSKGVYFISLQNGKQTINKKFVKE